MQNATSGGGINLARNTSTSNVWSDSGWTLLGHLIKLK